MRSLIVLALVLVAACVPPPVPPTQIPPTQLASTLPPVEVVRRATAKLISLGFDIAISDATGGVVQSKLARAGAGNVTCRWPKTSALERYGVATLTLSINAVKNGDGSAVTITSRVMAEYPGLPAEFMSTAQYADLCASTGALEQQVVAAISAP